MNKNTVQVGKWAFVTDSKNKDMMNQAFVLQLEADRAEVKYANGRKGWVTLDRFGSDAEFIRDEKAAG